MLVIIIINILISVIFLDYLNVAFLLFIKDWNLFIFVLDLIAVIFGLIGLGVIFVLTIHLFGFHLVFLTFMLAINHAFLL